MMNSKLKIAAQRRSLCLVYLCLPPHQTKTFSQFHAQRNWLLTHALHIFNQEPRCGERKWELFDSSAPSPPPPPASPNTLSFACHSRLLPVIITLITFLGGCARSLFGEPVYIRNCDEKFELLHTKKRPLWLHVSPLTHLNQPLTINNIAALTRSWHKKILTYEWYNDAQVYCPIASCCYLISQFCRESTWLHTRAFKDNPRVLGPGELLI